MKTILILLASFIGLAAVAGEPAWKSFSTSGTAINAGTNWVAIPNNGITPNPAVITFLSVRGLSANPITLTSYVSTNQTTEASGLTNSTTTLYVTSTNNFSPNNVILIQHLQNPLTRYSCEYGLISTVANTNQITLVTAPAQAVLPGDIVNLETVGSTISIATSTTPTTFTGSGILSGQYNEPWLLTISSSGAGTNTIDSLNVGWQ